MGSAAPSRAYTTLVTRSSYLAGVILLAYSLRKHGSVYPLVVCYTSTLTDDAVEVLSIESKRTHLILRKVDALIPDGTVSLIAERFADTWTKLRVFELQEYDEVCYLDADMLIFNRNMDEVFDYAHLTPDENGQDILAATHTCCCNLDHDSWADDDWVPENCPFTPLSHPDALDKGASITKTSPRTYHDLNGGLFLFRPSASSWKSMLNHFKQLSSSGGLADFKFPDQDFLAHHFRNRWHSLPWRFNALKTWRYWHPNIWRDDEVVCLHYIVDKPWASRIGEDGKAGYRGDDGETHGWWWKHWDLWVHERLEANDSRVVKLLEAHVASKSGHSDTNGELRNLGA